MFDTDSKKGLKKKLLHKKDQPAQNLTKSQNEGKRGTVFEDLKLTATLFDDLKLLRAKFEDLEDSKEQAND